MIHVLTSRAVPAVAATSRCIVTFFSSCLVLSCPAAPPPLPLTPKQGLGYSGYSTMRRAIERDSRKGEGRSGHATRSTLLSRGGAKDPLDEWATRTKSPRILELAASDTTDTFRDDKERQKEA